MANKTITRADLSDVICRKTNLSRTQALDFISVALREITRGLKKSKEVKLPLFGVFFVRHKNARTGRNPRTLEDAIISERNVTGFRVSRVMKERVNDSLTKKS